MLVHECESPPRMDTPFETFATPDPVVKLVLSAANRWILRTAQGWRTYDVTRGSLCFTRPDETHRLRWQQHDDGALRMIHVYIPTRTMHDVSEEMEIVGHRPTSAAASAVFFDDRTVANLIVASAQAARGGASDAYAQAAATLIAFHLQSGEAGLDDGRRPYVQITDQRLLRVLDYIEANYDQPLSLEALASQAGLSRYHFAAVFRRALGSSPHQHVREVRLRCSRTMLRSTERSILDIALSCGFANASHFAAAFRAECGESPTAYRARHRDR
jgi:AraC family transcriptional regulator